MLKKEGARPSSGQVHRASSHAGSTLLQPRGKQRPELGAAGSHTSPGTVLGLLQKAPSEYSDATPRPRAGSTQIRKLQARCKHLGGARAHHRKESQGCGGPPAKAIRYFDSACPRRWPPPPFDSSISSSDFVFRFRLPISHYHFAADGSSRRRTFSKRSPVSRTSKGTEP